MISTHEYLPRLPQDQFSFQCDTCGKRLRTRQALEAHQRKHNDDKRYSCNICSASYLLKRSLERHQRKHTGTRPRAGSCYPC